MSFETAINYLKFERVKTYDSLACWFAATSAAAGAADVGGPGGCMPGTSGAGPCGGGAGTLSAMSSAFVA